jgi:hypothetical protein
VSNIQSVRRSIRQLQRVKTWQLVIVLVLLLFITATFLRLNNIGMIQRRDAVIAADKQGDPNNTQNRLVDLQRFVAAHMNTGGNMVYLEHQHDRDSSEIVQKAATASNAEKEVINKKVDDICKPQFSGYNQGYVDCFAREYAKYAPGGDPVSTVKLPDPEKYRYVFAAPLWSPDFAGFSLLASLLVATAIVLRLIGLIALRTLLRIKYRDANA